MSTEESRIELIGPGPFSLGLALEAQVMATADMQFIGLRFIGPENTDGQPAIVEVALPQGVAMTVYQLLKSFQEEHNLPLPQVSIVNEGQAD